MKFIEKVIHPANFLIEEDNSAKSYFFPSKPDVLIFQKLTISRFMWVIKYKTKTNRASKKVLKCVLDYVQIHHPETRKPAFRWLGLENGPHNESKKRVFGTDLTNSTLKRCKEDGNAKLQLQEQVRHQSLENEVDTLKTSAKSFQFGPFAPVNVPKVEAPGNGKPKRVIDWENLASTYRPQYHNQGIFYLLLLHRTNFKSPVTI